MKLLLTSLLVLAVAAFTSAKPASEIDASKGEGELLPDYKCEAEGVFSDLEKCDCYIVCDANLVARRFFCEKRGGIQLYFKQSYNPLTKGDNICDVPSVAACPLLPPVTPRPPIQLPCVNETEGEACDVVRDCRQCGYCDEYLYCNPTTAIWTRERCPIRGDPSLVHVHDKLFWNQGSTVHGGTCAPFADLPETVRQQYKDDAACKQPCEFKEDDVCGQVYHYREPDINMDIWMTENWERLSCPAATKWDQGNKTCTFCANEDDTTCNCA